MISSFFLHLNFLHMASWRPTSSRRHPCFLPTTLIGIITGKYEMMAEKRKKSRCSNDGDFGLRGRRFWRDENDGDSVLMTESWQVCGTSMLTLRESCNVNRFCCFTLALRIHACCLQFILGARIQVTYLERMFIPPNLYTRL